MQYFNFFKQIKQLNYPKGLLYIAFVAMLGACGAKKTISKENGMVLEPIIVSKNNPLAIYRNTFPMDFIIKNTRLDIQFDFTKHELLGKAVLQIETIPFHPLDSIMLDAKSMTIDQVMLNDEPLKFNYAKNKLVIYLKNTVSSPKSILPISIQYIAQPDKITGSGSAAIKGAKGLYFINTNKLDVYKPTQIWTQGETESNSAWFPTVDKPNCKSAFEMSITVPNNYTTLCNGKLMTSKINGTNRTDTWLQSKPMSVYLAMMAIGEYAEYKDKWRDVDVNYYVEKNYAADAKENFNRTPDMIDFFSKRLGVDYPWDKYSQVTARDYVSGAMENTSASLFGEFVQKHHGELIDNPNDGIVAHELFHQWFGDLVTCESWSNLVLNEGFANYGEYLWTEYAYGKDAADRMAIGELNRYLQFAKADDGPIVRFFYRDREAMFSPITYKKGGRVLHLLRQELGDEIFFAGLKKYLETYQYKTAEVHDLRKVMEEVSGKDLNVFFNQWFFKGSHPKLALRYTMLDNKQIKINYTQSSDSGYVFQFPFEFDIVTDKATFRKKIFITQKQDSILIDASELKTSSFTQLPYIIADANYSFIGELDEAFSLGYMDSNFKFASSSREKIKLLNEAAKVDSGKINQIQIIEQALADDNVYVRNTALKMIDDKKIKADTRLQSLINSLQNDAYAPNREAVLDLLSKAKTGTVQDYQMHIQDSSFAVSAKALQCILGMDTSLAYAIAKALAPDALGAVKVSVANVFAANADIADTSFFTNAIPTSFGNERINLINSFGVFVRTCKNENVLNAALNCLTGFAYVDERESIKIAAVRQLNSMMDELKAKSLIVTNGEIIARRIEVILSTIYAEEKNQKAIAEYKRMNWIK
jgi:aminopeptidase N